MASRIMGSNHRQSGRTYIRWQNFVIRYLFLTKTDSKRKKTRGRFAGCISSLQNDTAGDAVVEATILFPIMIMIFAALVLLSTYLPTRAVLQRATQYAATAIATENSDTWLFYDESSMSYYFETDKRKLKNVYAELFTADDDVQSKAETIVKEIESRSISRTVGTLSVESYIDNKLLYKEAIVTATREFTMPVNLSLIGFPETIHVTATSTVAVQNANEFVRNVDIANDFASYIAKRYDLENISEAISSFGERISAMLGW